MKRALFHPKARDTVKDFPDAVKRELGKAIFDLQKGVHFTMPLARTMRSVAPGVEELRINDGAATYRVFYYTKSPGLVLIFHAFVKRTRKTSKIEIELAQKRLKEMLQ